MNIPELPIQVLAVADSNGPPPSATGGLGASGGVADLEASLIAEGGNLADRLNAHFMTSTSALQQKCELNQ